MKTITLFSLLFCSTFSFSQAPGGVAGSNIWLKANAGTTSIGTQWDDQSGSAHHYSSVNNPAVVANAVNYNPAIEIFNGQGFISPTGSELGTDWSVFFVAHKLASDPDGRLFGGDMSNFLWGYWGGYTQSLYLDGNPGNHETYNATTSNLTTPLLQSYVRSSGSATILNWSNGSALGSYGSTNTENGVGININQGAHSGGEPSDSRVAEFIVYPTNLATSDVEKVHTYLGVKYGLTLGHDYTSSNNTVVWNNTANTGYNTNIVGIGRDNGSALDQVRSVSTHSGALDINNMVSCDVDQEFFMAGSNGGSGLNTTNPPTGYTEVSNRIWKTVETGSIDGVTLQFSLSLMGIANTGDVADYALAVDPTDINFNIGASIITPTSLAGDILEFTNVDVATGFMALVAKIPPPGYPGAINTDLTVWFKADEEVYSDFGTTPSSHGSAVAQWSEQSGNGSIPSIYQSTASLQPTYNEYNFNYNPSVYVDGTGEFLHSNHVAYTTFTNGAHISMYGVMQAHGGNTCFTWNNSTPITGKFALSPATSFFDNGGANATHSGLTANNAHQRLLTSIAATNSLSTYIEGNYTASAAFNNITTGNASPLTLGTLYEHGYPGSVSVGEVVFYNAAHGVAEKTRVESYLALKYGLTISNAGGGVAGDYVNSTPAIVWDADENPSYHNDVIGLAKDEVQELLQKQSHTLDDATRIYFSSIATSNRNNTGSFTNDNSYILMGRDNGVVYNTAASLAEMPTGLTNCELYSRLEREWKVTRTNNPDVFNWDQQLDISAVLGSVDVSHLRLLIDDDGDFSNGGTSCYYNGDGSGVVITYNNPYVTVSNISAAMVANNMTSYMTIASILEATPLPVELMSFDVECGSPYDVLTWSTYSEMNNDFFFIESSQDGVNYQYLGQVQGAGNSENENGYTFEQNARFGKTYYRLSQVDFDGTTKVLGVHVVECNSDNVISISPNPFKNYLIVSTQSKGQGVVLDYNGKVVSEFDLTPGANSIDTRDLAAGIYIVKVTLENCQSQILKVVRY